jgi:cobalt/nickel transport system permease protein
MSEATLPDRLDPRSRVLAAAFFCAGLTGLHSLSSVAVALGLAALTSLAARLPLRLTLRRLAALEGFLLLSVASLPFTVAGAPVFDTPLGSVSREGLTLAALILGKAAAAALALAALLGTLEPAVLGRALSRLGAPDKLVHLYLFTQRYLHVLAREHARLTQAMKARGFRPGCNRHTWRVYGWMFGMLTLRSLERADRVLAAMRCRGFDGRLRSLREDASFRLPDGALAALALLAVGLTATLYQSTLIVTDQGAEKTRGMSRAAPVGADTNGHYSGPLVLPPTAGGW